MVIPTNRNVSPSNASSPVHRSERAELVRLTARMDELCSQDLPLNELLSQWLPLILKATGGHAGYIWSAMHTLDSPQFTCQAKVAANEDLCDTRQHPPQMHEEILTCIASELQPTLVPPREFELVAERPTNPTGDFLIVYPLKVGDLIWIIEVAHADCGPPASQTNFLKFVVEMTDSLLQVFQREASRQTAPSNWASEKCLATIADLHELSSRGAFGRSIAETIRELLCADQVIVCWNVVSRIPEKFKVLGIAGASSFDPKSPLVIEIEEEAGTTAFRSASTTKNQFPIPIGNLSLQSQLGCQELLGIEHCSTDQNTVFAIVGYTGQHSSRIDERSLLSNVDQLLRVAISIGKNAPAENWSERWHLVASRMLKFKTLLGCIVGGLCALIFIPVPLWFQATATLYPGEQEIYYAPTDAVVTTIHIEEGQAIKAGQPLLSLTNPKLEASVLRLKAEFQELHETLLQLRETLGKKTDLAVETRANLELQLQRLLVQRGAVQESLRLQQLQLERLVVKARSSGQVDNYGSRQNLKNRPVAAGDALITTSNQSGEWYFELEIPESNWREISTALAQAPTDQGVAVDVQLMGASDSPMHLRLLNSPQLISNVAVSSDFEPGKVILARVPADANDLPIKSNGAIATAKLHCGSVSLGWYLFRDVYLQAKRQIWVLW